MAKKRLPKFASDAEEGRWYAEHRDDLDAYFTPVSPQEAEALVGRLPPRDVALAQARAATARHKARTLPTSIRLSADDIAAAKVIAARKGLGYQTWLKSIVHQAIAAEAVRPRRRAKTSTQADIPLPPPTQPKGGTSGGGAQIRG